MKEYPEVLDKKVEDKTFIEAVLEPHRCYYTAIKDLFDKDIITGLAHITGGGIKENLNRILPQNVNAKIDASKYQILDIFKLIKKTGNINEKEMLRTFNLVVCLTVVCKKYSSQVVIDHVKKSGINAYEIGTIVNRRKAS